MTHFARLSFVATLAIPACGFPRPPTLTDDAAPADGSGIPVDGSGTDATSDSAPVRPPTVVSISPANHAVGVTSESPIVITFSTRMDQAATQAAFQSPDIPPGTVVMAWNTAGTILTVTPNTPLVYATGSDPAAVTAKHFSLSVTTTAMDARGGHLAEDITSTFSTLRRIQQVIQKMNINLTGDCIGNASIGDGGRIIIGDAANLSTYKGLLTFDITALPAEIHAIEVANVKLHIDGATGSPYPSLGPINVDQITFASRSAAFGAVARRSFGSLPITSSSDFGLKSIIVTAGVLDDYMNRFTLGNISQYRLSAAAATNGDAVADYFSSDTAPFAELDVDYTLN